MARRPREGRAGEQFRAAWLVALRGRRRVELLLGEPALDQADLQPGEQHAAGRPAAGEPLPQPLRAHAQGPDGQEPQAVQKGARARARRARRGAGHHGAGARLRVHADDVHPADGLLALRGGVPQERAPEADVDHEAHVQVEGDRHLHHHAALADPQVGQLAAAAGADAQGELRDLAVHCRPAAHRRQEVRPAHLRARARLPPAEGLHVPQGLRALLRDQLHQRARRDRQRAGAPDQRRHPEELGGVRALGDGPRLQVVDQAPPLVH